MHTLYALLLRVWDDSWASGRHSPCRHGTHPFACSCSLQVRGPGTAVYEGTGHILSPSVPPVGLDESKQRRAAETPSKAGGMRNPGRRNRHSVILVTLANAGCITGYTAILVSSASWHSRSRPSRLSTHACCHTRSYCVCAYGNAPRPQLPSAYTCLGSCSLPPPRRRPYASYRTTTPIAPRRAPQERNVVLSSVPRFLLCVCRPADPPHPCHTHDTR